MIDDSESVSDEECGTAQIELVLSKLLMISVDCAQSCFGCWRILAIAALSPEYSAALMTSSRWMNVSGSVSM